MTRTHGSLTLWCNTVLCALVAAVLGLSSPRALAQPGATIPGTPSGKPLAFTIVSIKPHGSASAGGAREGCYVDSCHFVDRPLLAFIMVAYNRSQKPIHGDPFPGDSVRFDLDAKIDPADLPATPLSSLQLAILLRPVLADRFRLRLHHEIRTLPVYNIILAKGGLKMKQTASYAGSFATLTSTTAGHCLPKSVSNGIRVEHDCTMNDIRNILEVPSGRYLIDKTGLTGHYDFELHWTPESTPADSPLADGPSIFTAVQEQLGLKLDSAKAPVDVLVIDSAQPPTPN